MSVAPHTQTLEQGNLAQLSDLLRSPWAFGSRFKRSQRRSLPSRAGVTRRKEVEKGISDSCMDGGLGGQQGRGTP